MEDKSEDAVEVPPATRYRILWENYHAGRIPEACGQARLLINHPDLSRVHCAGLHVLLAVFSTDQARHAAAAVEMYNDHLLLLPGPDMTEQERHEVEQMRDRAEKLHSKAVSEEERFVRAYNTELAPGATLQDTDLAGYVQFDLYAELKAWEEVAVVVYAPAKADEGDKGDEAEKADKVDETFDTDMAMGDEE